MAKMLMLKILLEAQKLESSGLGNVIHCLKAGQCRVETSAGKNIVQKNTCTQMFIAALVTIAKTWKQPNCPSTEERIKKMWHIYTMGYYPVIKWNETVPFAQTNGPTHCHTEWSKSEREKQISYINACVWNVEKMVQTNLVLGQE